MEADFQEKLKAVLSDPQALAKIAAIAQSLGGGQPAKEPPDPQPEQSLPQSPTDSGARAAENALPAVSLPEADSRLALLSSVKPLLRPEKQSKIDKLTSALMLAQMMKSFRR